ncbi:MAG: GNAT family N-acetyltransferase [Spirochaetota bacterium]|nr:GNAT family N-acetyltransferase [Spirochaetota bacterium]
MNSLEIISNLKNGKILNNNFLRAYDNENNLYYLRPVKIGIDDARNMSRWRRDFSKSFLSWIEPDENEVLNWLQSYKDKNNDIIFIIESEHNISIGQISIYNLNPLTKQAEFGRIIHDKNCKSKGIMTSASKTLIKWAFENLSLEKLSLEVFVDNKSAILLYKRLGFIIDSISVYYKTITIDDVVTWRRFDEITKYPKNSQQGEFREVYEMSINKQIFKQN